MRVGILRLYRMCREIISTQYIFISFQIIFNFFIRIFILHENRQHMIVFFFGKFPWIFIQVSNLKSNKFTVNRLLYWSLLTFIRRIKFELINLYVLHWASFHNFVYVNFVALFTFHRSSIVLTSKYAFFYFISSFIKLIVQLFVFFSFFKKQT